MAETKRVGIWIRVSTDMQVQGESPEHHEQRARYYTQHKDWLVVEVYRLEAVSGKSVMAHAETKRMLADVKSGHITALVFSKLARLARNTKELLEFADIFRSHNADLVSLSESIDTSSPAGRLFYTMIAAMAEWERAEIAERVAASVAVRAQMGKPLGGAASFGYKWQDKALVIDEHEAPVRKLLYELFIKHQRKKAVSTALNELGHRTRNGSRFSDTTVHRLLRDSAAKGERITNYTRKPDENRHWHVKPQSDWLVVPCPAIVSRELWDECNAILDAQESRRTKPGRTASHLLSGLVHCSCGKKMYIFHKTNIYSCKACKRSIAKADIDEIYQEHLKEYLQSINGHEYSAQHESEIASRQALLDSALREHTKLSKQVGTWAGMRAEGELSKEDFAALYQPTEARLRQLEKTIPEIEADIDVRTVALHSSEVVLAEAKTLYDQWQTVPFTDKRAIVELITKGVEIAAEDITINLAYSPQSLNAGNRQRNHTDSYSQPT